MEHHDVPDTSESIQKSRAGWRLRGQQRPPFADTPRPDQESVWDYPRPPALVRDPRLVEVHLGGTIVASTRRAFRVLETASPPTYYLPPEDIRLDLLDLSSNGSFCEWKGEARYWDLVTDDVTVPSVGWSYPTPFAEFADLKHYVAFYPAKVECCLAGERVTPQPGDFYGGWVTAEIVGPFKGEAGSSSW